MPLIYLRILKVREHRLKFLLVFFERVAQGRHQIEEEQAGILASGELAFGSGGEGEAFCRQTSCLCVPGCRCGLSGRRAATTPSIPFDNIKKVLIGTMVGDDLDGLCGGDSTSTPTWGRPCSGSDGEDGRRKPELWEERPKYSMARLWHAQVHVAA